MGEIILIIPKMGGGVGVHIYIWDAWGTKGGRWREDAD